MCVPPTYLGPVAGLPLVALGVVLAGLLLGRLGVGVAETLGVGAGHGPRADPRPAV